MTEEDREVDDESYEKSPNEIEDPQSPANRDVSAAPNIPGLIWPTQRSMRMADQWLMTVTAMETRTSNGNKTN